MSLFTSFSVRIASIVLLLTATVGSSDAAKSTNQRNAVSPAASVSIGAVYTQDFNTLPNSGGPYTDDTGQPTSAPLPAGWGFVKNALAGNVAYTVGTGSSNTGTVYSLGSTGSTDRALGEVGSGTTGDIRIGACFANPTSGQLIQSLAIAFTGEEWRGGGRATGLDTLTFEYSVSAASVADSAGTWVAFPALDFSSVQTPTAATVYDGNLAANRAAKSGTITGLSIPSGQTFCVRWKAPNITGNDDALAIDDFTLTPSGVVGANPTLSIADVSLAEGNSGSTTFTFVVQLSAPAPTGGVTFDVSTADGTATVADSDYVGVSLVGESIAAGQSSKQYNVSVTGDTKVEGNETFRFQVSNVTNAIVGNSFATGTIQNDDISVVAIHDIQGSGAKSPLEGVTLTTTGIVTQVTTDGYFLQTPDAQIDSDPNTSEGVFVFTSFAGTKPNVGDLLTVNGQVQEFSSTTNTSSQSYDPARLWMTEIANNPTFTVVSTGNTLPAPINLTAADLDPNFVINDVTKVELLEKYEGMRVQVQDIRVVQSTDFTNTFFAVLNNYAGRPLREPGIERNSQFPNTPNALPAAAPRFDSNPEVFAVDTDGRANLTPAIVGVGQVIATPIVGVLDYGPHTFQVLTSAPLSLPTTVLPIRGVRARTSNEFTIASMNVEQFDNSDARVTKIANAIVNTLQQPDLIGMQEVLSQANLDLLAAKVNTLIGAPNPATGPYVGRIGTITDSFSPAFFNAILYNSTKVSAPSFSELAAFNGRAPLVMTATITAGGVSLPLTLIDNHVKSLIGGDYPDDNSGRDKRRQNAVNIADLVQTHVLAGENVVLTGDFNSYQFNDSYVDVIGTIRGMPADCSQVLVCIPDSWSHTLLLPEEIFLPTQERYSYLFRGDAQVLDHILASPNLQSVMVDYQFAHLNSEYPPSFKDNNSNPARYSDHDHPVLYLRLQSATDISVVSTSVVFNRVTQTFNATLQLTNKTNTPVTERIFVVLKDLPAGVTVTNQAGTYQGSPYLFTDNDLAANGSTTLSMQYKAPAGTQVTYTPQVFTGVLP